MASGDAAAAEREAHSLKGVAGNLSFVCLYDLAARVTDALRANDIDSARTSCLTCAKATSPCWKR